MYTQLLHVQKCREREEFVPATKAMLDVSLLRKFQTTCKKNQFENIGKKNQQVSEQSVMDLKENTKELPILSNFSEQHGSFFCGQFLLRRGLQACREQVC